jgi:hypothetical protein
MYFVKKMRQAVEDDKQRLAEKLSEMSLEDIIKDRQKRLDRVRRDQS